MMMMILYRITVLFVVVVYISTNSQNSFTNALSPSYNHNNARKVASTKSTFVTPLTYSSRQKPQHQHQHQHQHLRLSPQNNENGNDLVSVRSSRMSITSLKDSRSDLEVVTVVDSVEVVAADDEDNDIYKTAIRRTLFWVGAAIAYGFLLIFFAGPETSGEFYAGYLLEQSLSIDNLLVFLLLFEYFKIPLEFQNKVLNWGIIGSIVMRATMIGFGAVALENFREVLLVFAGILIFSAVKVIAGDDDEDDEDLSDNQIVKFTKNIMGSTDQFEGDNFFTEIDGIRMATPMLLCMIAVEISDVVFAVDSIPAIFGVTEVRSYKN
jgi:TerC family integral membrane protein